MKNKPILDTVNKTISPSQKCEYFAICMVNVTIGHFPESERLGGIS